MNKFAKICMAGWTIFCFVGACSGMMNLSNSTQGHELSGAEALGAGMGLFIWLVVWAVPMIVLGIIALITKPAQTVPPPIPITLPPPRLCSDCGKYYEATASTCPHCGSATGNQQAVVFAGNTSFFWTQQNPEKRDWRQRYRPVIIIGLIVIAVIGVIVFASSGSPNNSQTASSPTPASSGSSNDDSRATPISAVQLYAAYQQNEVLADSQYKGKQLIVTGVVAQIRKDMFDAPVVDLTTANEFESVSAYLDKSEEARAAALSKGVTVTIECEGDGATMGSPILRSCRFLPPGYSSSVPVERTEAAYDSGALTDSEIENMTYTFGSVQYPTWVKFVDGQGRS